MRRVWTTRGVMLTLVLLLAASFVFMGRGANEAEASAFNPALNAALSTNAAGAAADINEAASWGTGPFTPTRAFPASSIYFTPPGWGIPDCSPTGSCPYGNKHQTGTFGSTTTFGVLGSQCALDVPVTFTGVSGHPDGMRNASTDPGDSIAPGASFADLNADVNPANGILDGAEHWNDLLNGLIGAGLIPSTPPRERQILSTNALGTEVWVDVLTYNAGDFPGAPATAGLPTLFVLENANPLNPSTPGIITDNCGQSNGFTQASNASNREYLCSDNVDDDGDGFVNDGCETEGVGASAGPELPADCLNSTDDDGDGFVNDGCAAQGPSGAVHRSNPGPGTKLFSLNSESARDADQGPSAPAEPSLSHPLAGVGFNNTTDTCPFTPNLGSPLIPAGAPLNGDPGEAPGDGIDARCDPTPTTFSGSDADGDIYLNRGDNCPLVANGPAQNNQQDVGEFASGPPVDGGPASDSIGDSCDLNPTVADGHYHNVTNLRPVCVTGGPFSDGDGDGWCDIEEAALGANPGSAASTPETLAVPGTCSDAADNDGDAATDLADTGCQLPQHDISIKKLNGAALTCNPSNSNGYNLILNNSQATDENGEISIYLDSQPSYVPAPGPSPAPGKSAGSVTNVSGATVTASGPINIDGDADVEWLTKATVVVKGGGSSTTVHVGVTYPACGGGPNATAVDYTVSADLCHANDVAPLGVSPLFGDCAGGAADGGQDANNGNDGVVTRNVDDISK